MTSQRKIEKAMRKNRQRSFHPAVALLAHADQELTLVRALALHDYGFGFDQYSFRTDTYAASAVFEPGDLRHLSIYASVPGYGEGAVTCCGVRIGYYIPGKSIECCVLTFARCPKEPGWVLEVKRGPRGPAPDQGVRHALHRLQVDFNEPRRIRHEEDVFRLYQRMLKDYHETVLIPRKAKTG